MEKNKTENKKNKMREVKIEKIVLSVGGIGDYLNKGHKLLKLITGKTPKKTKSHKRIPTLGVKPNLEIGTMVTLRKGIEPLLKRLLSTLDNILKKKQISENGFSFGIEEYIEIPGIDYQRDIGIMGFDVSISFKRTGRRVRLKKIKKGKIPKRQIISKEEIIKFMEDNFQVEFK